MNLELERKKLELKRVLMAAEEQAFTIKEREADILRLHTHIETQQKRAKELEAEIKSMEGRVNV